MPILSWYFTSDYKSLDMLYKKKVTVVIPTYNRKEYLLEAINSVLCQNYVNYEIVIVDDGSDDDTKGAVDSIISDKIIYIYQENRGRSAARNRGIIEAQGEYIAFLDSDDLFLPTKLYCQVEALDKNPNIGLVYSRALVMDDGGHIKKREWKGNASGYIYPDMLFIKESFITTPTVMVRASVFHEVGFFDETMDICEDLDLWRRIARKYPVRHILKPLAKIRERDCELDILGSVEARSVYYEKAFKEDPSLNNNLSIKLYAEMYLFYSLLALSYNDLKLAMSLVNKCIESDLKSKYVNYAKYLVRYFKLELHGYLLLLFRDKKEIKKKRDIKVLIVSHILPPSKSGQAIVLSRLFNNDSYIYVFASIKDYDVLNNDEMVCEKNDSHYYKIFSVKNRSLPNVNLIRFSISVFNFLFQVLFRLFQLFQIIKKEKPDIIISCTGDLCDIPSAFFAAKLTKKLFIPYAFDYYSHQWIGNDRKIASFFEPIVLRNSDKIIVPNEYLKIEYKDRYGVDCEVVHNPAYILELSYPDKNITNKIDEVRIVYTGDIYHAHFDSFCNLLGALEFLDNHKLKLHVYTSQDRKVLNTHGIGGNFIEFHKHLPVNLMCHIQQEADILFLPLAFESPIREVINTSSPGKMGEYLAAGRPILAHLPEGTFVGDYLSTNECGVVVDKNDYKYLAKALKMMVEDTELCQLLGARAYELAKRDFDVNVVRNKVDQILMNLLEV